MKLRIYLTLRIIISILPYIVFLLALIKRNYNAWYPPVLELTAIGLYIFSILYLLIELRIIQLKKLNKKARYNSIIILLNTFSLSVIVYCFGLYFLLWFTGLILLIFLFFKMKNTKKVVKIILTVTTLLFLKLYIGIYTHDEFGDKRLFIKYRPIWKTFFYSPRGMRDWKLSDIPPKLQEEQKIFDEFILRDGVIRIPY